MEIVEVGDPLEPMSTVVAVGVFDGVHRGHQALLAAVRRVADERDLVAVAVVPDRHPATVVRPDALPPLLTDLPQRFELLEAAGVDIVCVLRFDEEQSLQTAEDFVAEVLVGGLGAKVQVGGEDFHFGHRRKGDADSMVEIGARHDLDVVRVPLVEDRLAGGAISSSAIRGLLRSGELAGANQLLGRPYEIRGIVEHGDARGRSLGFPTANVAVAAAIALPSDGVYAGWFVDGEGITRPAAINIGRRPTFYDEQGLLLVEAFVLDFEGDLYGQHAQVRFTHRLRDEVRFDGVDALITQMHADVAETRKVLGA